MSIHITPPPRAGQPGPEAADEPARRASRFDQRGIALQTIIIMVVLLAIAGSVAAVLLSRAGEETANLDRGATSAAYGITNRTGCELGGHQWAAAGTALSNAEKAALDIARSDDSWTAAGTDNKEFCKPKQP